MFFNLKKEMVRAWKRGQEAAKERKSVEECPYTDSKLVEAWLDGFYTGQ
jgi:ribosome modulation factor